MRRPVLLLLTISILLLASCSQDIKYKTFNPEPELHYSYTLELVDGKVVSPDCPWVYCIEKQKGQDLTILNFTDIQIAKSMFSSKYKDEVKLFKKVTEELAERVQPDLITLTGDQCYGTEPGFSTVYIHIDSLGTPWAPVFGNHDNEQNLYSLKTQSNLLGSFENCLYMEGPTGLAKTYKTNSDSLGHYVINIVEIGGSTFRVVKSLIFMNTGATHYNYDSPEYQSQKRYSTYDFQSLSKRQISWYKDMVNSVQVYGNGEEVTSGVILHIPPYVYLQAAEAAYKTDIDFFDVKAWEEFAYGITYEESLGTEIWNPGYEDSFGVVHEPFGCPPYPDGFFDAVKELGSTDFILAGHDHTTNFCIQYEGVYLVYSMKTGMGRSCNLNTIGGTVIKISDDGKVDIHHELYP